MSGTHETGYDSEVEENYVVISSDSEEYSETESETDYDSGEEESDIDENLNSVTQENNQSPEAIITRGIKNLCQESIKTRKPLNSIRNDYIRLLERFDVLIEKFETEELEIYINAMIEKNNEYGNCIDQFSKIGAEKAVTITIINMKEEALKKLKKAEEEMLKRKV